MSEECKCLQEKYHFRVVKIPKHFWQKTGMSHGDFVFGLENHHVTIHGDSLDEIQIKKQSIIDQLLKKWGAKIYTVEVYSE